MSQDHGQAARRRGGSRRKRSPQMTFLTRNRLIAAVVAALAVATTALVIPSTGTAHVKTTLHFRELTTNGSAINAAGKANRQGDYLAWDDPLKDASTHKVVGKVAGVCMLVDVKTQLYDCAPVTYIL